MFAQGISVNLTNAKSLDLLPLIVKLRFSTHTFHVLQCILHNGGDASILDSSAKTPLHHIFENKYTFENHQPREKQSHGLDSFVDIRLEYEGSTLRFGSPPPNYFS
jgi:hypothetical protein